MVESGFTYIAVLVFLTAVIVQLDHRYPKISRHLPGIVVLYFMVMTLSTLGVWKKTDEVNLFYKHLKENLLQVMIFLMLLKCDLRRIMKLGSRMIIGFLSATLTICLGFIIVYTVFRSQFEPHTWKTFATLCGSWIGGTGNMVAVQQALEVPDSQMGYTLLMDSVNYTLWVMLLLAAVPFAKQFNQWTEADTRLIDEVGGQLATGKDEQKSEMTLPDMFLLVGTSFLVAALSKYFGGLLPTTSFLSEQTWTVLLATCAGVGAALTPLGETPGVSLLSGFMLHMIVALIGSRANFAELTQAPLYIFCGFLILLIHAILLALIARFLRLDLFTCGVASLANVGGVASAPILAAAYSEVLIPIGVLMAMMGYIVGTGGGLLVGKILSMIG